jgi:hypothetical protein
VVLPLRNKASAQQRTMKPSFEIAWLAPLVRFTLKLFLFSHGVKSPTVMAITISTYGYRSPLENKAAHEAAFIIARFGGLAPCANPRSCVIPSYGFA